MRDPIDDLRSEGQRDGPRPRAAFADELERTLRSQHAMGRPASDAMVGRDWRRPAIGWVVAGLVAVAGFLVLRGSTNPQQVDTATSVTVATSFVPDGDEVATTATAMENPTSAIPSSERLGEPEGNGDAPTTTSVGGESNDLGQPTNSADEVPSTTAPSTTAAPSTSATASTSATTESPSTETTETGTTISLAIDTRADRDRLTWTVAGATNEVAGFEIEWVQGAAGGSAGLVRDAATRTVTIDRPVDGAVGYRIIARDVSGATIAESDVVRAG